ncbi:hypothetical protein WA1_40575 [Scytonema hofmannii PCC 7110]|jgi:hypothetical protein|uniref:Uncharacterized protein n=1 Tax=Scytonema hofmannii PCC 7110 TaxID=128403 RepID=A0A139WUB5_9CYAN|nr:hypothetical protein WA1_40575 [Scytonema hofmannii PCC 7110]
MHQLLRLKNTAAIMIKLKSTRGTKRLGISDNCICSEKSKMKIKVFLLPVVKKSVAPKVQNY